MKNAFIDLIINQSIYIILHAILFSIVTCVFFIYRPYSYIDNIRSYITCNQTGEKFEIGPNLIYTFTGSLDGFNDKKARKLCQYGLIRDYADNLKTPSVKNYNFYPIYTKESNWIDDAVITSIIFIIGACTISFICKINPKYD